MGETILPQSKGRALAGLMQLKENEPASWSVNELGAILRHQLAAPLEYDLRTIAPGGAPTITAMTAAMTRGPRPRSFADLISHPHPPLDLLGLMKDFARAGRDDGTLPAEVGTILYYAAISLAFIRDNARISKLDDESLRKGVAWSASVPWIGEELKHLFADALNALAT